MGCETVAAITHDGRERGFLLCNTSEVCFGESFASQADADEFLAWMLDDPRQYSAEQLDVYRVRWGYSRSNLRKTKKAAHGCEGRDCPECDVAPWDQ